jgi:hypothetical protein
VPASEAQGSKEDARGALTFIITHAPENNKLVKPKAKSGHASDTKGKRRTEHMIRMNAFGTTFISTKTGHLMNTTI